MPLTRKSTSLPASAWNGDSLGLLLPFITTTARTEPSGENLMPSGVWPTVTVSTTRGGSSVMSITLTVSASPSPRPMFATAAMSPRAATSIPLGRRPAEISRFVGSTFVPAMDSTEMRSSPPRVTSAVLPSGEIATWLTPDFSSAIVTVPAAVTVLPWIV